MMRQSAIFVRKCSGPACEKETWSEVWCPEGWYAVGRRVDSMLWFHNIVCLDNWTSHERLIQSTRVCMECGQSFHPARTYQHYCSDACREKANE